MDKKNIKMPRFNLKCVWDGIRSSVSAPAKDDAIQIEETLRSEHFQIAKTVRHGFPFQPTAMAYDPVQNLLAIGTRSGSLRIFGRAGVDCHVRHEGEPSILRILFLVNEGALVTVCSDDNLHLWTLRQKRPKIVHSLKFQRERITYCHLPFQSKWLYIGTDRGNVHIVNIESFVLSGYVINWNKAIELSRKTHPGQVVHLSDNPMDPNKLLIGFECGAIVLWDLKSKTAEYRYSSQEGVVLQGLKSISWHHEGKQFLCSHADGSLATWNSKIPTKPLTVVMPHAKIGKDGKPEPCRGITKVEWKTVRNGEPYVIFSGGMPCDKAGRTPSLTVMHAKNTTVLEMEHNVVDFLALCASPWNNDFQDPYGIVVLLQNDLVVVDLTSPGYPCFENPYPMDIHESPVTACQYYADCPTDLIPAFYSVGAKQKRSGFSEKVHGKGRPHSRSMKEWPVRGGEWGTTMCSYPEIMLTGHADGSVKFWDASAVTLQVLYKLKTAKVFDRSRCRAPEADDDPFAIQHLQLCAESRLLVVGGLTHLLLLRFNKNENTMEHPVLEIPIVYEILDGLDSPEVEYPPHPPDRDSRNQPIGTCGPSGSVGSYGSSTSDGKDSVTSVRVKTGARRWAPGYQPDLCCLMTWIDSEPPPPITSCQVNSRYGLLAFGNECGLAIVDIVQKTCLLNMGTPDLYGSMDPYSRVPRSPKSKSQARERPDGLPQSLTPGEDFKPPTPDQCIPTHPSPVGSGPGPASPRHQGHGPSLGSITEVSFDTQQVKFTLMKPPSPAPEAEDTKSDNPADLKLCNTVLKDTSEASNLDQSDQNGCEVKVGDLEHNTVQVEAGPSPTKRPLRVSKSLPIQATSLVPRVCHVTTDTDSPMTSEANVVYTVETANGNASDQNEPGPVAPPRRRSKLAYKTSKKKEQDEEAEGAKNNRPFHSDSDLVTTFSEEDLAVLRALAADSVMADSSKDELDSAPVCKPKTGFMRRMSDKMKIIVRKSGHDDHENGERSEHRRRCRLEEKFEIQDLTSDDDVHLPVTRKVTYFAHAMADKGDGSFSRSRSSSMSSLENISKEPISCLVFADAYTRKTDSFTCPCLWVGTSLGSVLVIVLNLPPEGDQRMNQPVIVSPSGTIFRLKGAILAMSFLDCNGVLIPAITDPWTDSGKDQAQGRGAEKKYNSKLDSLHKYVEVWKQKVPSPPRPYPGQQSVSSMKSRMSPPSTEQPSDRQFAIICSEKQARVMSLPSQTCAYRVKITETSIVAKAEIVSMKDSVCLACYIANGHVMTFSLPSLKPLLDVDFLPLTDVRIAKTFSFTNNGHALYFCSPTEVQKVTLSAEISETLNEMLGALFIPADTPEAPKQSFFKNLFSGGASTLDREDLFGESSGKASKGVVIYQGGLQIQAGQATSAIAIARQAAMERGERLDKLEDTTGEMRNQAEMYAQNMHQIMLKEKAAQERGVKLGELEDTTVKMRDEAEQFAGGSHQLLMKYRDKKWYQF